MKVTTLVSLPPLGPVWAWLTATRWVAKAKKRNWKVPTNSPEVAMKWLSQSRRVYLRKRRLSAAEGETGLSLTRSSVRAGVAMVRCCWTRLE